MTKKKLLVSKSNQEGFTVPELLLMVLIIIILSGLVLTNYQAQRAKQRDSQRVQDINLIDNKLETYYNDKNAYPATLSAQELFNIDEAVLKDPDGKTIVAHPPVGDSVAAQAVANPNEKSASSYLYIPYPTGCTNAANNCTGFVLKTFIEKPTSTTPNPYTKVGINNN
ncbi:MAG: ral secretion pathway protein [Patescibacteria group bacterium]|nr:ral secretion pathway protein [Patescibacteria group bacterium]